jgi:hypothetical protein
MDMAFAARDGTEYNYTTLSATLRNSGVVVRTGNFAYMVAENEGKLVFIVS